MFDLFRSRQKSVRILLGGLLILVAASMLTYLIPSYATGSDPNDIVVAQVGKENITTLDVQRSLQNMMRGRQMPPESPRNPEPTALCRSSHQLQPETRSSRQRTWCAR